MVNRAFKAIRRADVVLLMVDVEAGITDQVQHPSGSINVLLVVVCVNGKKLKSSITAWCVG